MPKGKKKRKKENYKNIKAAVYIRVGSRVYTSFEMIRRENQRKLILKSMSPEQIEFCEKIKTEIENINHAPLVKYTER